MWKWLKGAVENDVDDPSSISLPNHLEIRMIKRSSLFYFASADSQTNFGHAIDNESYKLIPASSRPIYKCIHQPIRNRSIATFLVFRSPMLAQNSTEMFRSKTSSRLVNYAHDEIHVSTSAVINYVAMKWC